MYLCMQLENFEGFFILANFVYSYESKKNIGKEKATCTYYLGQNESLYMQSSVNSCSFYFE